MRKLWVFSSVVMVVVALATGPAVAEEDLIERTVAACEADIEQFCSQVTPGDGRLLACFVAHEDKISGECSWALYEGMIELEAFVTAVAYVATECRDDLVEHCGEVRLGEGRVGSCLLEKQEMVSDGCRAAIDEVGLEEVEE